MQGRLELGGIEKTKTEELQRTAAKRSAEDTGHLIVEFDCEHAVKRGELFLRDAGAGIATQAGHDASGLEIAKHDVRLRTSGCKKAIDERDGDGRTRGSHASDNPKFA